MTVEETKREMRLDAARRRRRAAATYGAAAAALAADALADNVLAALDEIGEPSAIVSGYWPMGDEIDVRPLLERLDAVDRGLALPVVVGKGRPLVFRRWRPGEPLDEGVFGTRHPPADAPRVTPGIVLAPLLAFDRRGFRLGWGGGFYDRTLVELRAAGRVCAVGVAFAAQEVERVPTTERDQRLDWIVTEAETHPARP